MGMDESFEAPGPIDGMDGVDGDGKVLCLEKPEGMESIQGGAASFAEFLEEGGEDCAAFVGHEAGDDPGPVIEAGVGEDVHQAAGAARLGVVCAEIDLVDSGEDDGAGAHGTGFEGDVEPRAFEPPTPKMGGCLGDRQDFSVRRGVLEGFALVVGLADDLAFVDDDAAYGDFAFVEGALGLAKGVLHVALMVIEHEGRSRGRMGTVDG